MQDNGDNTASTFAGIISDSYAPESLARLSPHNGASPMAGMITGEDCRRKAAHWLERAQAASDPKTSSSMRRASDAWIALAQQVERLSLRLPRSFAPAERPAHLVKSRTNIDSFFVGDMLRERLHLSDDSSD
jgi:hypothetical protein